MNEIYKIINDAIKEATFNGIKSNTIILNEKYDVCRHFYVAVSTANFGGLNDGRYLEMPPMLLGKAICLLELPEDYAFAITETNINRNCETLYYENQLLKKYLKLVGEEENQCLVIKGVSSKKHKEDFEKIKELIKNA